MSTHQDSSSEPVVMRVIGGPSAGTSFALDGDVFTIGRGSKADIQLADSLLSRIHAKLERHGPQWFIEDAESTNGTWLQGERLKRPVILELRTTVRVGKTIFELANPEVDTQETHFDESRIAYRMKPVSVRDLQATQRLPGESSQLSSIYKVQSLLTADLESDELYGGILEVITEALPADHAYLLLCDGQRDAPVPVAQRDENGPVHPIDDHWFSHSIINHVQQAEEAILSADMRRDERFVDASIVGMGMSSVMCVPMLGRRRLCGVIYLVSTRPEAEYNEESLRLLSAIAFSAAVTIENKRLMDENIRQERMAAIGMTAAGLSHYVKNILTGLEGSVSLLRMGIDSNDKELMNDAWEILQRNHKRLSSLVLDMLNLAKEDHIEIATFNITEIIKEVTELVRTQLYDQKVTLELDTDENDPIYGEVDSRGVHRAVLNLLNNAADAVVARHGDSGEGRIELSLQLDTSLQGVIITISDNGIGIPVADRDRIFDSFTTHKGDRGTGLGLAVTKRLVERHHGHVRLQDTSEQGSTFIIRLPLKQQASMTESFTIAGNLRAADLGLVRIEEG